MDSMETDAESEDTDSVNEDCIGIIPKSAMKKSLQETVAMLNANQRERLSVAGKDIIRKFTAIRNNLNRHIESVKQVLNDDIAHFGRQKNLKRASVRSNLQLNLASIRNILKYDMKRTEKENSYKLAAIRREAIEDLSEFRKKFKSEIATKPTEYSWSHKNNLNKNKNKEEAALKQAFNREMNNMKQDRITAMATIRRAVAQEMVDIRKKMSDEFKFIRANLTSDMNDARPGFKFSKANVPSSVSTSHCFDYKKPIQIYSMRKSTADSDTGSDGSDMTEFYFGTSAKYRQSCPVLNAPKIRTLPNEEEEDVDDDLDDDDDFDDDYKGVTIEEITDDN